MNPGVEVHNYGKLSLLVVGLLGLLLLVGVDQAELEEVDQFITGIILYALGDGVSAIRGRTSAPIISPTMNPARWPLKENDAPPQQ